MRNIQILFMRSATLLVVVFSVFTTGCATAPSQMNLRVQPAFYENKVERIGIYYHYPKEARVHIFGANCLLCLAAAAATNSDLNNYAKSIDFSEIEVLPDLLAKELRDSGKKEVVIIEEEIDFKRLPKWSPRTMNFAEKDHTGLKETFGVDRLIVMRLSLIGFQRPYTNYIPTGNPVAIVSGVIYMVDLTTNEYGVYEKIDYKIPAQGKWKEPPNYPGLTISLFEAIASLKERVTATF